MCYFRNLYGTKESGRMSSRNQIAKESVLIARNRCARMHKKLKISNSRDMKLAITTSTTAYSILRNETKRNEMVLCETVFCEMVFCETVLCEMVLFEMAPFGTAYPGLSAIQFDCVPLTTPKPKT